LKRRKLKHRRNAMRKREIDGVASGAGDSTPNPTDTPPD
jgi:hypothetical protein